jgi:hypothetical protein
MTSLAHFAQSLRNVIGAQAKSQQQNSTILKFSYAKERTRRQKGGEMSNWGGMRGKL